MTYLCTGTHDNDRGDFVLLVGAANDDEAQDAAAKAAGVSYQHVEVAPVPDLHPCEVRWVLRMPERAARSAAPTIDPKVLLERLLAAATRMEVAARQIDDGVAGVTARADDLSDHEGGLTVASTHALGGDLAGFGRMLAAISDDLKAAEMAATEGLGQKGNTVSKSADKPTEIGVQAAPESPMTAEQYRDWAMRWWAAALARPVLLGEAGRRFVTSQQSFWRAATTEECQRGADATPEHA